MKTILSIDCGTQSLRAILFDEKGGMISNVKVEYEPYVSRHPGWAEQDPDVYWDSLVAACQKLKLKNRAGFDGISGIGVTTQRASMINVDKNGTPLRDAILWIDQRRAKMHIGDKGPLSLALKMAGLKEKARDFQTQGACNWIRQYEPEIWKKTHKYLQVSGYLNFKLTGKFCDSQASQIGHLPFDFKKHKWAGPLELTRLLFPVEPEKLPGLVKPGVVIGPITSQAAGLTGIKKEIPVIACGSDKGCETLGAGVVEPDVASLSFGTTATVQILTHSFIKPIRFLPPYPALIPGKYNPEIEIFRGFWMISWFKKQFAQKEVELADEMGVPPEEILNKNLAKTPPGSMGLMVQPYWGAGLGHPEAKGAMIGFGDVHTKAHIYRAVIEGLAYALFEGLEILEKKSGVKITKAVVSGGASQSDEICKITADIFNRPIEKGQTHETSGLGAAIVTAKGLGWYPSIEQAADQMVEITQTFHPDPDNAKLYKQLYSGVYTRMYKILEPLYTRMRKITGYPKI